MRKEYDEFPVGSPNRMSPNELSRIIDFIHEMESEAESALGLRNQNRELRVLAQLMRDHMSGRLTTQTSLIASSGLAYGTALRLLQDLHERGLLSKRPRTKTGKTFSVHPSETLIDQWREYSRRVKSLVGASFGLKSQQKVVDGYYFGASYMCAGVIQQPNILPEPLTLSKLRMLIHADPTFMAMTALKSQIENILGTEIRTKALSIDRLLTEIQQNANHGKSNYDIVTCNFPWFGKLASEGALLPLDDLNDAEPVDLSDFYPETLESAQWRGAQYGIPVQSSPELLAYRTDLFAEAGAAPPRTVQEVIEAARLLHKPQRGVSGIAWNAARGTPLGHTFIMLMGSFGQPVIDLRRIDGGFCANDVVGDEHRPMMLSYEAFGVAEYLRQLLDYSPKNILSFSWYERANAYSSGECAMAYCYSLLAALFVNDPASPACRTTGFLPHPAGGGLSSMAPIGGYGLAIPSNIDSSRIEQTWVAIKKLTSPELSKQYILNGSTSTSRFTVGRDPEITALCPVLANVDELARFGQLQYWPRPPIPEITDIVSIVGDELYPMLFGEITIKEALGNTQNKLDQLMRSRGHY